MFCCCYLNQDLRLKPCLVVVICDHQIFAYHRHSSTVYATQKLRVYSVHLTVSSAHSTVYAAQKHRVNTEKLV